MNPLVLVIDTNPNTATMLLGTAPLTGARFDVRVAPDEVRALRALRERMPDLLLLSTDAATDGDWHKVIRHIRSAGCTCPLILIDDGTGVDAEVALDLGVREVLARPISASDLRQSLHAALTDVVYRGSPHSAVPSGPAEDDTRLSPEFEALYAVGMAVASISDMDTLLHRIVDAAVYVTDADHGRLMLQTPERNGLVLVATKSPDQPLASTVRLNVRDALAERVVTTGRPHRLEGNTPTQISTSILATAALYLPIRVRRVVIGVITVSNASKRAFSKQEERLLAAVMGYGAIAIYNAQILTMFKDQNTALEVALKSAQEADHFKAQVLRNLGHELRTPLVFIKGYIDMLYDGDFGELPDDIRANLRTVQKRIDDLNQTIDNAVSLDEPNLLDIAMAPVVLNQLVDRVIATVQPRAEAAYVTIVPHIPPLGMVVLGNEELLARALLNLLDNAIKFSPGGGLVTITASANDDARFIEVLVSDTGVGMPAEKLPRIFEPFYQIDATVTRQFEGAGLGLSAAQEIFIAHGGELTVESRPGQGSTFRFTLPRSAGVIQHLHRDASTP